MNIKKITTLGLFTTIALVLSLIDSMLPPPIPVPGIRLGLANIVILTTLYHYGVKESFSVLFSKIFLTTLFTGMLTTLFFSLCGGISSLFIMLILKHIFQNKFIVLTSIFGAIFHNIGQFIVAYFIFQNTGLFIYLPFLLLSAIITGFFIGICYSFIITRFFT